MEFVANGRLKDGTGVPWAFSQKMFAQFIDELESKTKWKYSGEAEIIVLSPDIDFSDCVVFNIEKMIKDRAIDRISELFESLIQYARLEGSSQSAHGYSEARAPKIFGDAVLGALLEGPKALGKTWKEGRHYATRNLCK